MTARWLHLAVETAHCVTEGNIFVLGSDVSLVQPGESCHRF